LIAPTTFKSKSLEAKVRQAITVRARPTEKYVKGGGGAGEDWM
jgi:hypothetical protein